MITLRVWFVMIILATVLAGGTLWSAVRPAASFPVSESNTAILGLLRAEPAKSEPRVDLYGNEIQDAVGDYRVDPRGDTYESHAPDTEVTRLSGPTL